MTDADKLAQVLAEHVSEDHYAGNGYNEPREAWVVCSCGADVWEWQQFYNENPADPEDAFRAHVAAVILANITAEEWTQEQGKLAQAWRDGYYTGKRDYSASFTSGRSVSTPNPYAVV